MKKDVYIYQSGTLKKENNTIALITSTNKTYIPIEQVDNIHIFGEMNLNKRFLQMISSYKIILYFYSHYGNYIGSYIPQSIKSGKVIVNQVESYTDVDRRLEIGKLFIEGNIYNEIALLKYYNKKVDGLNDYIKRIEDLFNDVRCAVSIDELLIIEAHAKQIYYHCLDMLLPSDFKLERRSTYPPHNEINAMLSYGYAIMYSQSSSAITRSKLIGEISYIHSTSKHGNSLQYDLVDILKPVIIDRLVLRLARKGLLKKEYFIYGHGVYLSPDGKKFFTRHLDTLLKKTVFDNRSKRHYSYKQLFSRDVYLLADHILNKRTYKYFRMSW